MTALRRTRTLASALVLTMAQATPALALAAPGAFGAAGTPAWACTPEDLAAATGSTARGGFADSRGTVREKDTGQVGKDMPASAKGRAPAGMTITVPIYWHVISSGTEGALTNAQIAAQVSQMNAAFGGDFGGPDTGFSFSLAGITRTDDATWYASRSGGAEHAMKQALKTGGDGDLNVYSTSGGAYLGWAYLPEITDTAQRYLDGIVIDWRTVPGASDAYEGLYDEGDTLVHEAGHWLNLEHTFYGGCNRNGDFVADTPAEKSAAFGCQVGRDTCTSPGLDPVHNYMDYSDDPCLTEFTAGQTQRMKDAWLLWRAS
jgi:hypothetical protein